MNKEYAPLDQIDFSDKSCLVFYIDTRDFHCKSLDSPYKHLSNIDIDKLLKYPERFFHTADEIKEWVDRCKRESGGDVEWRYFSLAGDGARYTAGWELKYITIIRTEHGLLVCNSNKRVLNKEILANPVHLEYLNAH